MRKCGKVVEIGWTKPTEVPVDWDDAKIKAANFNSRALKALFSAITNEVFKKMSSLKLQRKHGPFSRQPMREPRLSRIQIFKSSLQALKRLRWRRMSRLMITAYLLTYHGAIG